MEATVVLSASPRLSRARYTAYVVILLVSVALLYLFYARGMRFFLVPSSSMEPALLPNDYILTLREPVYRRGDIVVIRDPVRNDEVLYDVKRIIAVGGDSIEIKWGAVLLNGLYASEPYTMEPIGYEDFGSITVPNNHVFLLGDNRNHSEDSSVWPQHSIPEDAIVGKVGLIYLPKSRWQWVRHYPLTNSEEQ